MRLWRAAIPEGYIPVAFRSGQGTNLPLPGWVVSTSANFEWWIALLMLTGCSSPDLLRLHYKQLHKLRRLWPVADIGHCKRALLQAPNRPPSTEGGYSHTSSRLLRRWQQRRGVCASAQNRVDRTVMYGSLSTCMRGPCETW